MNRMRFIAALLLGLAIVAGGRLWLQREAADVLRIEIGLLREISIIALSQRARRQIIRQRKLILERAL